MQDKSPNTAIDDDGAFSVDEFCSRYDISRTAFYEEVNGGKLIAKKRGARTLVPRQSARAWLEALPCLNAERTAANQTKGS